METIGTGKMARDLDPDINPWDRQPWENEEAYAAFVAYRDTEGRRGLFPPGPRPDDSWSEERAQEWRARRQWLKRNSAIGSWVVRCMEWDRHVARQDAEDLIRYRRSMNERHRNIARAGLAKISQWIVTLNPDSLKPSEAIRLLEVSARLEREAAGANLPLEDLPEGAEEAGVAAGETLGDVLRGPGAVSPGEQAALAERLHRLVGRAMGARADDGAR